MRLTLPRFFKKHIQMKISAMLVVMTTLVLSGYGVYQYWALQSSSLTRLNELADNVSARLAESLKQPLWNADDLQVQKVVMSEMQEKNILAIQVKNERSRVLIAKERDHAGQIIDMPAAMPSAPISRSREITQDDLALGVIELAISTQAMQAELRQTVKTLIITMLTLNVVLLAIVTLTLRNNLIHPLTRLLATANIIARGDFSQDIAVRQEDEIGDLANAFREMQAKIAEVVCVVKTAAQDVAQRSREMHVAAEQTSEGSSQQAAATEEVSASMEEMAAAIRQTARNAKLAEDMAATSANDANAGKQAVIEIIQAMEVIAKRISIVQEIAGQTNMLSLNATIEAAKAQEYGKGFTVVASSVRDLAHQTRSAADDIHTLVHSCLALSVKAGEVLQRLVPNSEQTARLTQEICAANQEQSTGVEHVNLAVLQLDSVTQRNAGTAEELASTSETLTTQADVLQQAMAFFTVKEAQPAMQAQKEELLRLLDGIEKEHLVALLTSALDKEPSLADRGKPNSATSHASESRAHASGAERRDPPAIGATDERDQEFERY